MITDPLSGEEKYLLLKLARQSIELAVGGHNFPQLVLQDYSPNLREHGASFVTLTEDGDLRGCIGALEPYQPLVQDVCEHAVAAALDDFRFSPVTKHEVQRLVIEISHLTIPQPLLYEQPQELPQKLKIGSDGVIIRDGIHRATFLPQVWEKLPDPVDFLSHLCQKMGVPSDVWKRKLLQVFTYQVEEFQEGKLLI